MPELTWIGKDAVRRHHLDVPFRPLVHQYDFATPAGPDTPATAAPAHRIIHGDNLEALKSLLPEYEGRVRCIYIDPPYNTGNKGWIYNDNVSDPRLLKWINEVVKQDDLSRHDKWLCMMYPRLKLLYKLLSEDGVLLISIGDDELANLLAILQEMFPAKGLEGVFVWKSRTKPTNAGKAKFRPQKVTEYIVLVTKKPEQLYNIEMRSEIYSYPHSDDEGNFRYSTILTSNLGSYKRETMRGEVAGFKPPENKRWKAGNEEIESLWSNNRMGFIDGIPYEKIYEHDFDDVSSPLYTLIDSSIARTAEVGKTLLNKVVGAGHGFDTVKPVELMEYLLSTFARPDSIILDSFAGSGTTLHAVLNLNARDKENGRRQCLLIEMENYAETLTAERARRVITGYGSTAGTGGAFGFYTLGPALFGGSVPDGEAEEADATALAPDAPVDALRQYVWYSETAQPLPAPGPDAPDHPAYLGTAPDGTRVYLHYDPTRDTVLDRKLALALAPGAPRYVVYADACLLSEAQRTAQHLVFKKIPRDIVRF